MTWEDPEGERSDRPCLPPKRIRENGDVELADMVNSEPFNNYDLNELFGVNLQAIVAIVNVLHNSVVVKAA